MALRFQDKKGIGVIFNWIFSLIAGVLIFSFLVYFAVQNTDLFGKVTARVVGEELDILFSGYETTQTSSVLEMGKEVELEFECENGMQKIEVNGKGGGNTWGKVIFAPSKIKSDKIYVATQSWNVPYRAGNFIYVWGDNEDGFEGSYPMHVEFLGDENLKAKNVEFKSFDNYMGDCDTNSGKTIYYSHNDELDDYQGVVCFNKKGSKFYGEAMMLGALFVDTKEDYDCIKGIIEKRLKIMNSVYDKKKGQLNINKCASTTYTYGEINFKDKIDDLNFGSVKPAKDKNSGLVQGGCAGVF